MAASSRASRPASGPTPWTIRSTGSTRPHGPQIEDGGSPATGQAGQANPPRRYTQQHRPARRTTAERDRPNRTPTDAGTRDHHRGDGKPAPRDERIAEHAKRDAMRPDTAGEEEQADKPTKPDDDNTYSRASRETAPSRHRATKEGPHPCECLETCTFQTAPQAELSRARAPIRAAISRSVSLNVYKAKS